MKTASWFQPLPDDHQPIGISRGTPRTTKAGFQLYRKLAPGPWFKSVDFTEYYRLYRAEILAPLDPHVVAAELMELSNGRIPVLLCFERPDDRSWCHRAMAAEWLAERLGQAVPEFGFEQLSQEQHPMMPGALRRPIAIAPLPVARSRSNRQLASRLQAELDDMDQTALREL